MTEPAESSTSKPTEQETPEASPKFGPDGHPPRKFMDDLPMWILIGLFTVVLSLFCVVWYQRLP